MARSLSLMTDIQRDDEKFNKLSVTVKGIGVTILAQYKLVSDVTIYKYLKREPCAPGIEESILESVEAFLKDRKEIESKNIDRLDAILAEA